MSVRQAIRRLCEFEQDDVPRAERLRALAALAAIVAAALVTQAAFGWLDSPAAPFVNAAVQLSAPFLVAWSLRRIAGPRVFAMAAILVSGLLVPVLFSDPAAWAANVNPNAMVATGMIWILSSERRAPTRITLTAATILAVAFAVAAFI